MKPVRFEYLAPASLKEAIGLLDRYGAPMRVLQTLNFNHRHRDGFSHMSNGVASQRNLKVIGQTGEFKDPDGDGLGQGLDIFEGEHRLDAGNCQGG